MFRASKNGGPGRHGSNVLPTNLSPTTLLAATEAGWLIWARSENAPMFKAGGSVPKGLHAGREIWIALMQLGGEYQLTLTSGVQPYCDPLSDRDGMLCRCTLGKLWAAV